MNRSVAHRSVDKTLHLWNPYLPPLSPQPPEKEENATDVLLLGYPFVLYNTAYFREW